VGTLPSLTELGDAFELEHGLRPWHSWLSRRIAALLLRLIVGPIRRPFLYIIRITDHESRSEADHGSRSPNGILLTMPIFEYRCEECGKKFSALVGMTAEPDDLKCPHCGKTNATKLVSRFARYRNEDDRIDEVADQLELAGEPDSPSAMREMVRSMGKAMDEDVSDEMEEMFEADLEGGGE
jgi:putative FmdB family regulatory protein